MIRINSPGHSVIKLSREFLDKILCKSRKRSEMSRIYFFKLNADCLLIMYKTYENMEIMSMYDDIRYNPKFDPVNKLKFIKGDVNHNFVCAYTRFNHYTLLKDAYLTIYDRMDGVPCILLHHVKKYYSNLCKGMDDEKR